MLQRVILGICIRLFYMSSFSKSSLADITRNVLDRVHPMEWVQIYNIYDAKTTLFGNNSNKEYFVAIKTIHPRQHSAYIGCDQSQHKYKYRVLHCFLETRKCEGKMQSMYCFTPLVAKGDKSLYLYLHSLQTKSKYNYQPGSLLFHVLTNEEIAQLYQNLTYQRVQWMFDHEPSPHQKRLDTLFESRALEIEQTQ